MIRVVIADDEALVRAGLRLILESRPDLQVVAEAEDGEAAVRLVTRHRPDVVLMDIRMPKLDGLEATRRLVAAGPVGDPVHPTRILVLTTFDLDEYVYRALQAGAGGFLLKGVSPEHLVNAVRAIASGDTLLGPSVTRRLIERFARPHVPVPGEAGELGSLTQREMEVLLLVARGLSNAEIADLLVLSEATVKTHVAGVLSKLGLRNRVQAVVLAYESGLVTAAGSEGR